ncbi:GntR family transcriptional regulator [Streptomyces zagrosensis]|uniref:DNA-binding transcriptional regulator YhcF (GntR family) n=1 Tax=Streptomyces zagrosensis TaxID=1042984 RepID=A0A7W9V2W0_9ACTN|nr:GntR family transcriptional regulator [Streptomyces zagrosensis]MBB5939691.1 DNA-binding transcriptional regulator YhcF (GntR family) [Streptomyces zagrosensis]
MLGTEDIVAKVRGDITEGVYRPGDALPSPESLAAELRVLTRAVEAAYRQLADGGLLMANLLGPGVVVADPELDPTIRAVVQAVHTMQHQLERFEKQLDHLSERVDTVRRMGEAGRAAESQKTQRY